MKRHTAVTVLVRLALIILVALGVGAQAEENPVAEEQIEHADTLATLANMIENRQNKADKLDELKKQLSRSSDEVENAELLQEVEQIQQELDELNEQIGILATGVSAKEYDLAGGQKINLQGELEQLVQPFVIMLKSATAEARQIEQLRHKLLTAEAHIGIAEKALEGIAPLSAAEQTTEVSSELSGITRFWQEKLEEATDLQATVQHQLEARLQARKKEAEEGDSVFGNFFQDRGLSLVMGIGAAIVAFTLMKLLGSLFGYARERSGVTRTFKVRLSALIFNALSVAISLGAMLYVFNARNDWLLLGLVVLFVIALLWMGLKMIPEMLEQITLLLNLGAVQEGERVLFNGVPWHVKKLDFYTDLENPALTGGQFTLPVRELLGLHSRPASDEEVWFPSRTGDWVKMEDGTVAKVVFQSPEVVQLVELGGARQTMTAPAFFESAPTNLSSNARVEVVFGVSYKHQAIAAREIPQKLIAFVETGLLESLLDKDELLDVNVELMECNSSSLDYEVEADITGDAAHKYEDVERALTRLCLEACNEFGWEIPFPQIVVHRE